MNKVIPVSLMSILVWMSVSCQMQAYSGIPNAGQWQASAKFCDFSLEITTDQRVVIGAFNYPCEMRCGIYEAYGHFQAFTPGTVFTSRENNFDRNPPPPSDESVDFPITGSSVNLGPFWLAMEIENMGRLPVAQLSLDIRFTSATTLSGKYYYQGTKPSSTTLVRPICQGKFSAEWVNP